jgi:exonuclease SbcC
VLDDGLIGIIGPNGSGKSTIVEAISFALYGSPAIRGKIDFLRTRADGVKDGKKSEPAVHLTLEHDGLIYRIQRTVSDALLFMGGEAEPFARGNREVTSRVASIVGMNHAEFLATYCTEQKSLEFLGGTRGAAERERFIVRMMGFDRLEQVQERLRSDRKDKRSELAGFEASLGDRAVLERQLTEEQREVEMIAVQHEEAKRSLATLEHDVSTRKERMVYLEELRTRFQKVKEELQGLTVRREEQEKRFRYLNDEVQRGKAALGAEFSNVETVRERLAEIDAEIDALRTADEAAAQGEKLIQERWQNDRRVNAVALAEARQALRAWSAKIEKANKLRLAGACTECGQPLGTAWHGALRDTEIEGEVLTKQVAELVERDQQIEQKPEGLTALERERGALRERLSGLLQERERCARREKELATVQTWIEELDRFEETRAVITKEIEAVEGKLAQLRFSEETYRAEKAGYETAQRLTEVARIQRVRLEGDLRTKEAMVARSRQELERYDEKASAVTTLRRELLILDESDRAVTEFRKHLNAGIRPRLAELASEYLSDLTDGRYAAVELGADFTPTVIDGGEAKSVISGGEQDILNLCMRIALSHMIADRAGQGFSLLILDEVFGSLDQGRRTNVLELLERLGKRFDQILIISHLDDVKEGVHKAVYVDFDEQTGTSSVAHDAVIQEMAVNV